MGSHLDSQLSSHLDSQLLSLAEYSNKYHISISTLRRKIRAGTLPFSFKQGKYFLKDQSLVRLKQSKSFSSHKETLSAPAADMNYSHLGDSQSVSSVNKTQQQSKAFSQTNVSDKKGVSVDLKKETVKQGQTSKKYKTFIKTPSEISDKKGSVSLDLLEQSVLLNKMVDSQKELLKQVKLKEIKVAEQQNRIMELNTLVALLEKENQELKSLLYQEKEMEEWLELK